MRQDDEISTTSMTLQTFHSSGGRSKHAMMANIHAKRANFIIRN